MKTPWSKEKKPPSNDESWKKLQAVVNKVVKHNEELYKKMNAYQNLYDGKIWGDEVLTEQETGAVINVFFSTIQSIAPMLTDQRPIWSLIAHKYYFQNLAMAYSEALKYFWETRDMDMVLLKTVMTAMIKLVGIFKIYYDPSDGLGGNIRVCSIDPTTFFMAPGYDDPWEAPWCGCQEQKPLSWIRRRFPGVEIQPEATIGNDEDTRLKVDFDTALDAELDIKTAQVTELWIRDDAAEEEFEEEDTETKLPVKKKRKKYPYGKYVYFTKETFLGEEPYHEQHGKPPYVALYDYVKPFSFVGTGELDNLEGLGLEMNYIWRRLCNYVRRVGNPNIAVDQAAGVDIETVKKTYQLGGQVYTVDSATNSGKWDPIKPIGEPMLNPMVLDVFSLFPRILEEISGVTEIAKGVLTTKQERSAREADILAESSYTRVRQRVRNLETSIKRLCYLWVRMMQQYFDEPRDYYTRKGDQITYGSLDNSSDFAKGQFGNIEELKKKQLAGKRIGKSDQQRMEDYEALVKALDNPADPVYFDFDIVIQTNSTLPLDKQTLANLILRLLQEKAVDNQAVLETLQIPNSEEIMNRMNKQAEMEQQAKSGSPSTPQPGPLSSLGGLNGQPNAG